MNSDDQPLAFRYQHWLDNSICKTLERSFAKLLSIADVPRLLLQKGLQAAISKVLLAADDRAELLRDTLARRIVKMGSAQLSQEAVAEFIAVVCHAAEALPGFAK